MSPDARELEFALRDAVDRGQLHAWFQPQVDVATSRIVALEALARWQHPDHGVISPADFIPLAEENGAIEEIGQFMTTESLAAIEAWEIDVSVNVSPVQLEGDAFTTWLERILRRNRSVARRLTLEITEQRRIEHSPAAARRLDLLRATGAGVAIDDFGMGHSSLTQLKRLHGSELKLDRQLVADDSEETTRLLARIVALAHEHGARVVAEGVETVATMARVVRLGCDRAQGYLIGRPLPRNEMARHLARHRAGR